MSDADTHDHSEEADDVPIEPDDDSRTGEEQAAINRERPTRLNELRRPHVSHVGSSLAEALRQAAFCQAVSRIADRVAVTNERVLSR